MERFRMAGVAKAFDHSCIVHCIWLMLARLRCCAWVERVPTADNIADLPSRESYELLKGMRAKRVEARLDASFTDSQAWESLCVVGVFD